MTTRDRTEQPDLGRLDSGIASSTRMGGLGEEDSNLEIASSTFLSKLQKEVGFEYTAH